MSRRSLILDGFDLSALGLVVTDPEGFRSPTERELETARGAGRRASAVVSVNGGRTKPRVLEVGVAVEATSHAELRTFRREIVWRFRVPGDRELQFTDDETGHYLGQLLGADLPMVEPALVDADPVIQDGEVRFLCADPFFRADADTQVALSATFQDLPLWDARVEDAVVRIDGAATPVTDPSVEYADKDSVVQKTLAFKSGSVSLGAGQFLDVDFGTMQVTDSTGANRRDDLVEDTDHPIFLDPHDGDHPNGLFPKMRLQAASGAPTGQVTYRRRGET